MTDQPPYSDAASGPAPIPAIAPEHEWQSLDPAFISVQRLVNWISCGVLALLAVAGMGLLVWRAELDSTLVFILVAAGLGLAVLLAWTSHFWPPIEYRHRAVRLDDRGIEFRKGVLWRSVIAIPRSRIQHTDVNQGPIDRLFGVASLVIHTAGTISASVTIDGLAHTNALRIRDFLIQTGADDAV